MTVDKLHKNLGDAILVLKKTFEEDPSITFLFIKYFESSESVDAW